MDRFQVRAKDTSLLSESHLVAELQQNAEDMDLFPVLIGEHVAYFHEVDGGYDEDEGRHIVNLIHAVQGPDSPPNTWYSTSVEAHLGDVFINMDVEDVWQFGDYPDEDFTVSYKVEDYRMGPQTFTDALREDIDKREQEYAPDDT